MDDVEDMWNEHYNNPNSNKTADFNEVYDAWVEKKEQPPNP